MKLNRLTIDGIALAAGVVTIGVLSALLPAVNRTAAVLLLDWDSGIFPYPFTIQNVMLLLFFLGLGELAARWRDTAAEAALFRRRYLPEDDRTVLQGHDLGAIRKQVLPDLEGREDGGFLPQMINRCALQFLSSRSIDGTNGVLNSLAEIYFHRIDLRYTLLRYLAWVIPTLGFIGTVVGIAGSLSVIQAAGKSPDLAAVTGTLAVAFNTTMVALALSAVLVFLMHLVQEREERNLNRAMEYCVSNLINRLYSGATP
jgi:hypothetical protein